MVNKETILDFFKLLNLNNLRYVLIKNDEGRIPCNVEDGDDIDILIHPKDYDNVLKVLLNAGYEQLPGESYKYFFVYKMRADIYLKKGDGFFHIYDKLSCVSYTNMGKSKVPLDIDIQNYIWDTCIWDKDNQWWIMSDEVILLYLIIRSVFDKKVFRKKYISEIEKRTLLLDNPNFKDMCSKVFFKYTDNLINKIKNAEYEEVINDYKCFVDY